MAAIDDGRAKLVTGQAEQLRDDARRADELLRRGKVEEARAPVAWNFSYACAIAHELESPPATATGTSDARGVARAITTLLSQENTVMASGGPCIYCGKEVPTGKLPYHDQCRLEYDEKRVGTAAAATSAAPPTAES